MSDETPKKPAIKFSDVLEAYESSDFGAPSDVRTFLNLETGEVRFTSEMLEPDDDEDPADWEESDSVIELPTKYDLNLGQRLVFAFADAELSDGDAEKVRFFFRKKGAYRRFKDLLESRSMLERWYEFRDEATKRALRIWCEDNGIALTDS
jgi:hypothetical protein